MIAEFNAGLRLGCKILEYHKRLREGRYKFNELRHGRAMLRHIRRSLDQGFSR